MNRQRLSVNGSQLMLLNKCSHDAKNHTMSQYLVHSRGEQDGGKMRDLT